MSPPGGVLKHGLRSAPSDRIWRCSVPALHDAFTKRQSFSFVFVTILDLRIHSVSMVVFLRRAFSFAAVHIIVYFFFRVRVLDRARFLSSILGVVCIRCILFFRLHALVWFGLGFLVGLFFFVSFLCPTPGCRVSYLGVVWFRSGSCRRMGLCLVSCWWSVLGRDPLGFFPVSNTCFLSPWISASGGPFGSVMRTDRGENTNPNTATKNHVVVGEDETVVPHVWIVVEGMPPRFPTPSGDLVATTCW